jgi:uncharacterized delta-60 repeat protein
MIRPTVAALAAAFSLASAQTASGAAGQLDQSFNGGIVDSQPGVAPYAETGAGLAVQPDAKPVAAGSASYGPGTEAFLTRFTSDGQPDGSFGAGGTVTNQTFDSSQANGVAIDSAGRLVVAGQAFDNSTNRQYLQVLRYLPDGRLDPSFGSGGKLTSLIAGRSAAAASVLLAGDGKIVIGGSAQDPAGGTAVMVARLAQNGTFDSSFGSGGVATLTLGGIARSIALEPDGGVVLADYAPGYDDSVSKLTPSGGLDGNFGDGGSAMLPMSGGQAATDAAVALQPDGKVLVAGNVEEGPSNNPVMTAWRFTAQGRVDTSFGAAGQARVPPTGNQSASNGAQAMALEPDGKLLLAGGDLDGTYGAETQFEVARLLPSGGVDGSFGSGGSTLTRLPHDATGSASAMTLDSQGRILLAGQAPGDTTGHLFIARYLNDAGRTSSGSAGSQSSDAGSPLQLKVALGPRQTPRTLAKRGLLVRILASARGRASIKLMKRARTRKRTLTTRTLGRTSATVGSSPTWLRVRPSRAFGASAGRKRKIVLILRVGYTDTRGRRTAISRTVLLRSRRR